MRKYMAVVLLVGCAAAFVVANGGAQQADAPKGDAAAGGWQHLALTHEGDSVDGDPKLSRQINQLGRDGWELVSVTSLTKDGTTVRIVFCFKRPL